MKKLSLVFALLISIFSLSVANAQFVKVPGGILVTAGKHPVAIRAVAGAGFSLGLNDSAAPAAIRSVFIDAPHAMGAESKIISVPPAYGIQTAAGKLMINTATNAWSLYGADGKALIQNGNYAIAGDSIQINYSSKGLLYGSGNKSSKELVKDGSASSSGNGTADVPYYWSNAGYAAFAVSANDDHPATWKRSEDQSTVTWKFPGKAAELHLWPAKTMYDAARGLTQLTGRPAIPPRWAFGYQQSKWGWDDSTYVSDVANKFRTHQLPVDAFIFDFEWYTTLPDYAVKKEGNADFSDFDFNGKVFPSPVKQIADLKNQHIKFIGIRKPRLGNTALLDTARKNGWLKYPATDSRDLDYANAGLRNWYNKKNEPLIKAGVDAWWDDEGESYYTCYYWWNKSQYDLLASARPDYRHFTLNRSFSPGNQRFGYSTWSGDIPSTWHALAEVPMDLLNFSLAGTYYGSCDIGGFQGTPTKEMLVRWYQAGVFLPIMRSHSNIGTTARFPFLWGDDGEAAIRKALNLRYQLLPYLYSLGHDAYATGAPIMRPLVMEFPADTAVANLRSEWLIGAGLLAAPLLDSGGQRTVYLPKDTWYDYFTGEKIAGPKTISLNKSLDEIPVYVRAGTILPVGPVVQYSEQASALPLEIRIYPGKNGTFKMTEDDGVSYNYRNGAKRITTYSWNDATKTLSWKVTGNYAGSLVYKNIKVVMNGQEKPVTIGNSGQVVFK